jgi:hypothetical protein
MSIALHAGSRSYEVGTPSFLKAFFSTVYVRAEARQWGARFPTIMRELYSGHLPAERCNTALVELADLRRSLARHPPEEVVWDFEKTHCASTLGQRDIAAHHESCYLLRDIGWSRSARRDRAGALRGGSRRGGPHRVIARLASEPPPNRPLQRTAAIVGAARLPLGTCR